MEMKNMVVLRDLPSNIVEEAWIIIKPEIRNKEKELIKRIKNNSMDNKSKGTYVLEEAQSVIEDYLKNINNYRNKKKYEDMEKKYNKLKKRSRILLLIYIVALIFSFIF